MGVMYLDFPNREIDATIQLEGSKSLSNRALIIRALCDRPFDIQGLSEAEDTQRLRIALEQFLHPLPQATFDAGHGGTTLRFLAAFLALQPGQYILTGSERLQARPVGPLIEALRQLGANIQYLGEEGYPPLRIEGLTYSGVNEIYISADVSSQFLSALAMIAPRLPEGLVLIPKGAMVSRSYFDMTLRMMGHFGIKWTEENGRIHIPAQSYHPTPYRIEADWSAASYYYSLAILSDKASIRLDGLQENSLQGDRVIADLAREFGVETSYLKDGVHLEKQAAQQPETFEHNFVQCPDIAQTMAVVAALTGTSSFFSGLETLRIKETDRVAALQSELTKLGSALVQLPARFSPVSGKQYWLIDQPGQVEGTPTIATYQDHRMAMAFAPAALLGRIGIEDPEVVQKSYPGFWEDMKRCGMRVET